MKNKISLRLAMTMLLFGTFTGAPGGVIRVPGDCLTIQEGLIAASVGDTVLVAPGTYHENLWWPLVHGIKLLSESGPDTTVIDGDSATSVIYISGILALDTTTVIRGFTIRNGGSVGLGGGVAMANSSPTIENNIIRSNTADALGGGILMLNSSPRIRANTIEDNSAEYGGGGVFCIEQSSPSLVGNTISGNSARDGGGVFCRMCPNPTIAWNQITANSASYHGGGIHCSASSGSIRCNVVAGNNADSLGDGIYCEAGSSPVIDSNSIYNNGCGVYNRDSSETIMAEDNWWGHQTGPYDPSPGPPDYNPGGQGDSVTDYVYYRPWLTEPVCVQEIQESRSEAQQARLFQNRPNPFSQVTRIGLQIPDQRYISLSIYDATGRLVKTLVNGLKEPGCQSASWDGKDERGRAVPTGVYFYRLKAGEITASRKMLLVR